MYTNTDITLFNAYIDSDDITHYNKTVIHNANWQSKKVSSVSDKGLNSANETNIFIPVLAICEKQYIEPKKFNKLTDKAGYFTFKAQDKVIKGIFEGEIKSEKDFNKLDNVATILTVSDNRFGSLNMQHFQLVCK